MADTTAKYYLPSTAITARNTAESTATLKLVKSKNLSQRYMFVPVSIKSYGTFSQSALDFLHELGLGATTVTLDPGETSFPFQQLSIATQRFNAVCFANIFFIN